MSEDELHTLRAENTRLIALLESHGIDWRLHQLPAIDIDVTPLTTEEKVALFRKLFRGRTNVYPIRRESKAGKSGYSLACANVWKPGVCEKPRTRCVDGNKCSLIPLTERTDHLKAIKIH